MKILLISPRDPQVPSQFKLLMGGESTYTNTLLKYPPNKVEWIYFEDALQKNLIASHWSSYFFLWLQKLRILPPGPRVQALIIKTSFDRIYAHGYPVKIKTLIPLIISDSSSNIVFLRDYLHWPQWRITVGQLLKKVIFTIGNVVDGEVNSQKASKRFMFSQWAQGVKRLEVGNGKWEVGSGRWEVIYPGLPVPKITPRKKKNVIKLLFVGVWFERKGGKILLSVFRRLVREFPHISLTILGQMPKEITTGENERITQKDYVSYKELCRYYRTHDILVHIPPVVEGYGMVVPEAMSHGMCPVVSRVCALPEFVQNQRSGMIIDLGSEESLEQALRELITKPSLLNRLQKGARKRFVEQFSIKVFHQKLVRLFKEAIVVEVEKRAWYTLSYYVQLVAYR